MPANHLISNGYFPLFAGIAAGLARPPPESPESPRAKGRAPAPESAGGFAESRFGDNHKFIFSLS